MHQESSQVNSEQIQLCISDAQASQLTICFNVAPNIKLCSSSPVLSPTEAWVTSGCI